MASEPPPASAASPSRTGLLIDWGGVLTTSVFDSFAAFCEHEGLPPDALAKRLVDPRCRELLTGIETGRLRDEDFETRFAAILGVPPEGLIARVFAGSRPDPMMVEAVRAARAAGIKTALVSNSWGTGRYDREALADLFDAVVISGEVGIRKPAPEVYLLAAERLGLSPEACVFVDDLPFNLPPAAKLGMATIHHVRAEQTAAELERLLGLELRHRVRRALSCAAGDRARVTPG